MVQELLYEEWDKLKGWMGLFRKPSQIEREVESSLATNGAQNKRIDYSEQFLFFGRKQFYGSLWNLYIEFFIYS